MVKLGVLLMVKMGSFYFSQAGSTSVLGDVVVFYQLCSLQNMLSWNSPENEDGLLMESLTPLGCCYEGNQGFHCGGDMEALSWSNLVRCVHFLLSLVSHCVRVFSSLLKVCWSRCYC